MTANVEGFAQARSIKRPSSRATLRYIFILARLARRGLRKTACWLQVCGCRVNYMLNKYCKGVGPAAGEQTFLKLKNKCILIPGFSS